MPCKIPPHPRCEKWGYSANCIDPVRRSYLKAHAIQGFRLPRKLTLPGYFLVRIALCSSASRYKNSVDLWTDNPAHYPPFNIGNCRMSGRLGNEADSTVWGCMCAPRGNLREGSSGHRQRPLLPGSPFSAVSPNTWLSVFLLPVREAESADMHAFSRPTLHA